MKLYIKNPRDARKDITNTCTIRQQSISTTDDFLDINITIIKINRGKIGVFFNRWKYKDYYSRKVPQK